MSFVNPPNENKDAKPSSAVPLSLPATSGEVTGSGPGEYLGFTARETSGSAALKVTLYDNATAASGVIVDEIYLAESTSGGTLHTRGTGIQVKNGLYASITGALTGSVFQ